MTEMREHLFDATRSAAGFDVAAQALIRPALAERDAECESYTEVRLNDSHLELKRWVVKELKRAEQAEATIARVKAIHTRGPRTNTCNECGMTWPCSTVEALAHPDDTAAETAKEDTDADL